MRIRTRIMLALTLVAVGAMGTGAAVFLHLQKRALQEARNERVGRVVDEATRIAEEAVLAKDSLVLLDFLRTLPDRRPEVAGARVKLGGTWTEVGSGTAAGFEREVAIRGADPELWGRGPALVLRFSRSRFEAEEAAAMSASLERLGWATALVCLLGLLVAWPVSGGLTRRISRLADEIERVRAGGKLGALTEISGRDEIADLARRFNEMSAELAELDKMKKTFVSSVTHELRSPLGAISSYVDELLAAKDAWNEEQRTDLERIKENAGRLSRFVTSLLDMAALERGTMDYHPTDCDVTKVVRDTAEFFASKARAAGLRYSIDAPGASRRQADPDLLGHLVTNLISNAIKFTPPPGEVAVRVKDAGGRIRVEVKDSGVGIKPEDAQRLFQAFTRVRNASKAAGTGLGLSLAKGIAEMHGGSIGVESTPGRGSTFWFELP